MIRIIPRLDIKGPNLVKGVHLEGLRVLGKPEVFATRYYEAGADELIYIDSVASLYGRQNLLDIVKRTAGRIFIPLTAGGGVRSVDDVRQLLRAGADKVAINTAAVHNPSLIKEAAQAFGSQCVVISIAAKRQSNGTYEVLTDNARESTGKDAFLWAKEAIEMGAGEILLTSVDCEGTGRGYELNLIKSLAKSVPVPVIVCGGAGHKEHFVDAVKSGADALCAASIFHYHMLEILSSMGEFKEEGNVEFIKRSRDTLQFLHGRLKTTSIGDLKKFLISSGISCRPLNDAMPSKEEVSA